MNSSRFSHSYHFSLAGVIKLSNLESVIDSLNIPLTIGLSPASILLAALVFIPFYALILLHIRAGSSRKTPSVPCKEYASRRGVGQKGEIVITVPAPIGSTHETELRVSKETNFPKDWWTSERLFQAEKRAIFSKVTNLISQTRDISQPPNLMHFAVVALCNTQLSIPEARRLSFFRASQLSLLSNPRKRPQTARISQCLPSQGLPCDPRRKGFFDCCG